MADKEPTGEYERITISLGTPDYEPITLTSDYLRAVNVFGEALHNYAEDLMEATDRVREAEKGYPSHVDGAALLLRDSAAELKSAAKAIAMFSHMLAEKMEARDKKEASNG